MVERYDRQIGDEHQTMKDAVRTLSPKDRVKVATQMLSVYEAQVARANDMFQFFRALKAGASGAV